jgi:hypothetical protein
MGKYIWRKINVGLGKEAVRWTAVAPWIRVPKASLDFEDKTEKIIDESSIGVIEDSFNGHITKQRSEWSLECNMYANSVWYLLLNLFWAVSTSGANPYTHAFTVAETNQHQSLTIGLADDTQDRQFALAMLDSLEISAVLVTSWKWQAISKQRNQRTDLWRLHIQQTTHCLERM